MLSTWSDEDEDMKEENQSDDEEITCLIARNEENTEEKSQSQKIICVSTHIALKVDTHGSVNGLLVCSEPLESTLAKGQVDTFYLSRHVKSKCPEPQKKTQPKWMKSKQKAMVRTWSEEDDDDDEESSEVDETNTKIYLMARGGEEEGQHFLAKVDTRWLSQKACFAVWDSRSTRDHLRSTLEPPPKDSFGQCNKPGHMKGECPEKKKEKHKKFHKFKKPKAMVATWSDEDSSEKEEEEKSSSSESEEICFMANSSDGKVDPTAVVFLESGRILNPPLAVEQDPGLRQGPFRQMMLLPLKGEPRGGMTLQSSQGLHLPPRQLLREVELLLVKSSQPSKETPTKPLSAGKTILKSRAVDLEDNDLNAAFPEEFYMHLECTNDGYKSKVKGIEIDMPTDIAATIFKIPDEGADYHNFEFNLHEAYTILTGLQANESDLKQTHVTKFNTNTFPPVLRLTHHILTTIITPQGGGRDRLTDIQRFVLYCMSKDIKVNLHVIMYQIMSETTRADLNRSLPYAAHLTQVFKHFGVPLENEKRGPAAVEAPVVQEDQPLVQEDQPLVQEDQPPAPEDQPQVHEDQPPMNEDQPHVAVEVDVPFNAPLSPQLQPSSSMNPETKIPSFSPQPPVHASSSIGGPSVPPELYTFLNDKFDDFNTSIQTMSESFELRIQRLENTVSAKFIEQKAASDHAAQRFNRVIGTLAVATHIIPKITPMDLGLGEALLGQSQEALKNALLWVPEQAPVPSEVGEAFLVDPTNSLKQQNPGTIFRLRDFGFQGGGFPQFRKQEKLASTSLDAGISVGVHGWTLTPPRRHAIDANMAFG
ncbi:hypothetical protein Taro_016002 [Colocasia esculenta]|uniref:Putative plant transposon protein domain-containing protein n=1 Tax=Colocasia esculenta TaxID=4460 RepID=A0A843UCT3_COLES|nr:hypothetical protein [Colocasia esculenta]